MSPVCGFLVRPARPPSISRSSQCSTTGVTKAGVCVPCLWVSCTTGLATVYFPVQPVLHDWCNKGWCMCPLSVGFLYDRLGHGLFPGPSQCSTTGCNKGWCMCPLSVGLLYDRLLLSRSSQCSTTGVTKAVVCVPCLWVSCTTGSATVYFPVQPVLHDWCNKGCGPLSVGLLYDRLVHCLFPGPACAHDWCKKGCGMCPLSVGLSFEAVIKTKSLT